MNNKVIIKFDSVLAVKATEWKNKVILVLCYVETDDDPLREHPGALWICVFVVVDFVFVWLCKD